MDQSSERTAWARYDESFTQVPRQRSLNEIEKEEGKVGCNEDAEVEKERLKGEKVRYLGRMVGDVP